MPDQSVAATLLAANAASGSAASSTAPASAATTGAATSSAPNESPISSSLATITRSPALSLSTPHTRCAFRRGSVTAAVGRAVIASRTDPASAPGISSASATTGEASAATTPTNAGPTTAPTSPSAAFTAWPVPASSGPVTCGHTERAVAISGGADSPASPAAPISSTSLCDARQPATTSPSPTACTAAKYGSARGPRRSTILPRTGASSAVPAENAATAPPATANEPVARSTASTSASP